MNEGRWVARPTFTKNWQTGLRDDQLIEYRLAGDGNVYRASAGMLDWGDRAEDLGVGRIQEYRAVAVLPAQAGVGDVNGTALGTAARFNASKPDLSLIPAGILGKYSAQMLPERSAGIDWQLVLMAVGKFQMRDGGAATLLHALWLMDDDGLLWADCARVFDYGRQKYSAWNWARGQAWSIPIASALRHIMFGTLQGETLDPESGLRHRGHIACNIVMLLWFIDHYPEGDDRFTPPALSHA